MKEKRHLKWFGLISLGLLLFTTTLSAFGCLTPTQIASLKRANNESRLTSAMIAEFDAEINQVQAWIDAKKVDVKEGQAMIKKLVAKRGVAKERYAGITTAIIDMEKNEMPWYGYLFAGLNALAGVGGAFLGVNKIGNGLAGAASVSRGLDNALRSPDMPKEIKKLVLTALSDAVDSDDTRAKAKALHHSAAAGRI